MRLGTAELDIRQYYNHSCGSLLLCLPRHHLLACVIQNQNQIRDSCCSIWLTDRFEGSDREATGKCPELLLRVWRSRFDKCVTVMSFPYVRMRGGCAALAEFRSGTARCVL